MLKYIELKTGYNDDGPAWIARVEVSRSGRTVYFNGKALKRGGGRGSNHVDLETGEGYWVSGVKKDGRDRHWAGSGVVMIERSAVGEYLALVGKVELDRRAYRVVEDFPRVDVGRLSEVENAKVESLSEWWDAE